MIRFNIEFLTLIFAVYLLVMTHGVSANCNISTPSEILNIIKKNHPYINLNKSNEQVAIASINVAKQRPNPQFQVQNTQGNSIDGSTTRTTFWVRHTVELGGKRDSRIDLAQKFVERQRASARGDNENIIIDAVLKSYRLRQVYDLLPIYIEAHKALNKILKIKMNRKSLSPEEEVERETLVLATNDYKLKIARLNAEKINLSKHLSLFLGMNCNIPVEALPKNVNLMQEFSIEMNSENYSKLQMAKKSLNFEKAKLKFEESQSYPDLKIGPAIQMERINGRNYQAIGINLMIDLPILNSNSGRKEQALKSLQVESFKLNNIQREVSLDLQSWINRYDSFRDSLKIISNRSDLKKKHLKIEALFKRGIISTAMVIETHRQLIEFSNTRYEFELGVVESLWNIYKLNGTVLTQQI